MSAAASTLVPQTRPTVRFWNRGRRPEEQGYTFGETSLSLSDLVSAKSFNELQNKGVPASVCDAAKKAGYMPSEIDEYLEEIAT
jgi:hypothetical protein